MGLNFIRKQDGVPGDVGKIFKSEYLALARELNLLATYAPSQTGNDVLSNALKEIAKSSIEKNTSTNGNVISLDSKGNFSPNSIITFKAGADNTGPVTIQKDGNTIPLQYNGGNVGSGVLKANQTYIAQVSNDGSKADLLLVNNPSPTLDNTTNIASNAPLLATLGNMSFNSNLPNSYVELSGTDDIIKLTLPVGWSNQKFILPMIISEDSVESRVTIVGKTTNDAATGVSNLGIEVLSTSEIGISASTALEGGKVVLYISKATNFTNPKVIIPYTLYTDTTSWDSGFVISLINNSAAGNRGTVSTPALRALDLTDVNGINIENALKGIIDTADTNRDPNVTDFSLIRTGNSNGPGGTNDISLLTGDSLSGEIAVNNDSAIPTLRTRSESGGTWSSWKSPTSTVPASEISDLIGGVAADRDTLKELNTITDTLDTNVTNKLNSYATAYQQYPGDTANEFKVALDTSAQSVVPKSYGSNFRTSIDSADPKVKINNRPITDYQKKSIPIADNTLDTTNENFVYVKDSGLPTTDYYYVKILKSGSDKFYTAKSDADPSKLYLRNIVGGTDSGWVAIAGGTSEYDLTGTMKSSGFVPGDIWTNDYLRGIYRQFNHNGQKVWGFIAEKGEIIPIPDIQQLIATGDFAAILDRNGNIWYTGYCWISGGFVTKKNFTKYSNINNVKNFSTDGYSWFVIKDDGTLWVAGYNSYGQLGLGDTTNRNTFTELINIKDVRSVSANESILIVKNDGTLWVAGKNNKGQLGLGDTTDRNVFTQVPNISNAKKVRVAHETSFFINEQNELFGTGENYTYQLGLNHNNNISTFTKITSVSNVLDVQGAANLTLALTYEGIVYSTGANGYGQLGLGDTTDRHVFTNTGVSNVKSIDVGGRVSLLIKKDNTIFGCGQNERFLGLSDNTNNVLTFTKLSLTDVKIATTGGNSNIIALKNNNTVWAIGSNYNGCSSLGDVNFVTSFTSTGFTI